MLQQREIKVRELKLFVKPDKKVIRKQTERRLRYSPVLLILHVLFANIIELFLTITVVHCCHS